MSDSLRPTFIECDPEEITRQLVGLYESTVGKTLHPAQPERLFIDVIAYRECLLRQGIQEAAEQNLVAFARDAALDQLGANIGVSRLAARPAACTVEFTLNEAPASDDVIPLGTRLSTGDGAFVFTTKEDCYISAGQTTGSCEADCSVAGVDANGYLPGSLRLDGSAASEINGIAVSSATNTTVTALGADEEDDDTYRERLPLALESFSCAGPSLAYRYFALQAHSSIVDVAVVSNDPGIVKIYPLTASGAPSQAVLDLVAAACSDERVRPLTDQVQVIAPTQKTFSVEAVVNLFGGADRSEVLALISQRLSAYRGEIKTSMGRDVVPTQIIALLHVDGVYSVELISPAAATVVEPNEYPYLENWTINVGEVRYE